MIPTVKTWILTTADGTKYDVTAPTKRLALLNFRFEGNYSEVKSIGLSRSRGPLPTSMVTRRS